MKVRIVGIGVISRQWWLGQPTPAWGVRGRYLLHPHAADPPPVQNEEGLQLEDREVARTVGGVITSLFDNVSNPEQPLDLSGEHDISMAVMG